MAKDPTAADRQRRYRERLKFGVVPVQVELTYATIEKLIDNGEIPSQDAEDKNIVSRVISRLINDD